MRFDDRGAARPDFVLNKAPWDKATILIVGDNFGCGSSREHAVWGMGQLGITCAFGTGFASMFYDNARKNGLVLPIVTPQARDQLLQLASDPGGTRITIDIAARSITAGDLVIPFKMDGATQTGLIRGGDDTLDSLEYADAIGAYEASLTDRMRVNVVK
ncbi:3-isopropylmalate dehydratase small subunit [Microbulbifer sp. S227A]|uniref:3-isopropylmalate dehydratase small subunit n=1 Tax=Microbulbifer sp. S227A TaxID=3415131 RepID=UPI003C7DC2A2